jgi:hypothetical protein
MRYDFYDLSRVPLGHNELSAVATDAWSAANDPEASLSDCPWNGASGRRASRASRYKRLVWRSVFRRTCERRLALVTEINAMAGRELAA